MIYNFSRAFSRLGHQVILIAAKEYEPIKKEDYEFIVIYMKSYMKKILPPSLIPFHLKLIPYLLKNKKTIDLVISSEIFSINSLIASCLIPSQKILIWHELSKHNKKMKKLLSKFWYNVVCRLFMKQVRIIPRSTRAGNFIRNYSRLVAKDYIFHGIDPDIFPFCNKKKNQFIIVAQLIKRKNIEAIINSFHRFIATAAYKNYSLQIIGSGPEKDRLEMLVKRLNIEKHVTFHGFKPHRELAAMLGESKASLIASKKENSMLHISEAIAAGTPIITNTIPDNADFVHDNNLGIVQDGWNEEALITICKKNDFFVRNCLEVRKNLSYRILANRMLEIYARQ